jgi:hypothetical protein
MKSRRERFCPFTFILVIQLVETPINIYMNKDSSSPAYAGASE